MPILKHLDRMTGEPVRSPKPIRYEMDAPDELVNEDIKKLGRNPDGGGHLVVGRQIGKRNTGRGGRGYANLHNDVDG